MAFTVITTAASGESLLWERVEGNFPVGINSTTKAPAILKTVGGFTVECGEATASGEIGSEPGETETKFAHLFTVSLSLTKCVTKGAFFTGECSGVIFHFVGHLGLADPGRLSAVLLLIPTGTEYECTINGAKEKIESSGAMIATITAPSIGTMSKSFTLSMKQVSGKLEFKEFLLSLGEEGESYLMTNQQWTLRLNGGPFEEAGLSNETTLATKEGAELKLVFD